MNNHEGKFLNGFMLGAMVGGAAVFFLGTRTGRNLIKIVSEQGLDGIADLLEEYDLASLSEEDEEEEVTQKVSEENHVVTPKIREEKVAEESVKENPKKRFFRKIKR